jgi:K+-sensing histidine kinase KdpD
MTTPALSESADDSNKAPIYKHGWPYQRSWLLRYGVAIGVAAGAFLLRYTVFDASDHRFPFLFFVPAAMVAAWYGGLGPGLLTTAAGLLLGDSFFLAGHRTVGPLGDAERIAIGLYAVSTTLCVMLFENLHNRIRRLEHALTHAKALYHHKPAVTARPD